MRTASISALVCAALGLLVPSVARADAPRQLRHDTVIDISVTSVAGVAWLTSELLKPMLVSSKCRWCYRGEDGTDLLNPVDRSIRDVVIWKDRETAGTVSSGIAFFLEPMTMMGLTALSAGADKAVAGFPLDALLITEATFIAADVNQVVKYAFARERPFAHFLPRAPDSARAVTATPSDDNLSFFSGHTTLAFALATSAGTITTLRGYSLAPVVWATGLTMATSVAYLRMAADQHYFSDVLTGAIVGSVIGIGIPFLLHSPTAATADPAVLPSASGQALSGPAVRSAFSMSGAF